MKSKYQADPLLSDVAIAYTNDAYVAEEFLPSYSVKKQDGKHWIYNRGRFRNTPSERATGAQSGEVELSLTTGLPYSLTDHALKMFVPDEDAENSTAPTDPYSDATEFLSDQLLVQKEIEAKDLLTSTANLTQNVTLTSTDRFDDYANSDPFSVFEQGKQTVHAATHREVNKVLIPVQVWNKLKYHPAFLEKIKYTQRGQITPDLLASLLEVDKVVIAKPGYNTANEGQADSMSYIWGKDILMAAVAPMVAPKTLTLGLNYQWSAKTKNIKRLRGVIEEDREGEYVRIGGDYRQQKLISASCGYLIKTAVS